VGFLYAILVVYGLCFAMSGIASGIHWASDNVEAFLVLAAIVISVIWVINKRSNTKLENSRLEAESKARQDDQIKRIQLESSVKYRKLSELLETLKPYSEPIILRLNTLAEFKKYDKRVALDIAYDEICSKYKFLNDNHFSDRFKDILAIYENASEYVKGREETLIKSIDQTIHAPVRVIWSYVSPAGRNNYSDSAHMTVGDLQEYERHREMYKNSIDAERSRRERERQMLTKKMRYEIMERDNFRCQICGRTAQDGVTLEVDHKKPIAKGGKTEPDNLWTLCMDCNRGKGAKYDEDDS